MYTKEMIENFFVQKPVEEENQLWFARLYTFDGNCLAINEEINLTFKDKFEAAEFYVELVRFWKKYTHFSCSRWVTDQERGAAPKETIHEDEWRLHRDIKDCRCEECECLIAIDEKLFGWTRNFRPFEGGGDGHLIVDFEKLKKFARENLPEVRLLRMREEREKIQKELEDYTQKALKRMKELDEEILKMNFS